MFESHQTEDVWVSVFKIKKIEKEIRIFTVYLIRHNIILEVQHVPRSQIFLFFLALYHVPCIL